MTSQPLPGGLEGPWPLIGLILEYDGFEPGDMGFIVNVPGGSVTVQEARKVAAGPALYERLQAIIDWADLALKNPQEFDGHGVRNLAGPVFDEARAVLAAALSPHEAGER